MSSPVTTHTLNLGFSSHRRADSRYLPGRTTFTQKTLSHADPCALFCPPLRRSQTALLSMSSPVTTHTLNLGFSSHRRADSRYLPGRTTFTQKTLSHADPCALFRSPLRRSHSLSYRHAHLSTPTRRVSVSLRADARFSACRCTGCNSPFHRFPVASKKNETFFENLRTFFPF